MKNLNQSLFFLIVLVGLFSCREQINNEYYSELNKQNKQFRSNMETTVHPPEIVPSDHDVHAFLSVEGQSWKDLWNYYRSNTGKDKGTSYYDNLRAMLLSLMIKSNIIENSSEEERKLVLDEFVQRPVVFELNQVADIILSLENTEEKVRLDYMRTILKINEKYMNNMDSEAQSKFLVKENIQQGYQKLGPYVMDRWGNISEI